MPSSLATTGQPLSFATPTFGSLRTQPPRPGALLLGTLASLLALAAVVHALGQTGRTHRTAGRAGDPAIPFASPAASGVPAAGDSSSDDSDFDTIVLGDAADAPVPARPGDHVSDVHPFAVVHLPRFGDATGLIPATPAGHLLYNWLAAFNQSNSTALANALPSAWPFSGLSQMELREMTGGFALLSAKEIQPGILVFRLRDQTTQTEALGTLRLRPGSRPATIQSFSLRAVTPAHALTSAAHA